MFGIGGGRGWDLPERLATDERLVLRRRGVLAGAAMMALPLGAAAQEAGADRYQPGRPVTPEAAATSYNNYYEFGLSKDISRAAAKLKLQPWQVRVDGLVAKPKIWDVDELLKQVQQDDRVLRHRCVEAWGMTVPWTGFPLQQLVKLAEPSASAKYVRFETAQDPKVMVGMDSPEFTWPYVEGVTMQEAGNELAFLATGMYGKPLPAQNGGPLRLVLPWKYGFKSVKAIVRVTFTDTQPDTFWSEMQPSEYGFWANVNPAVPHPRWSQATERLIGSDQVVPTAIYNGYGEWVAGMYPDTKTRKYFM